MTQRRVLLIGHGGREAALADSIATSAELVAFATIKNPMIAQLSAELKTSSTYDPSQVLDFAKRTRPDFVMIGPEEPISLGVGDTLKGEGFDVFAPSASAARLEWDKAYMRAFLARHAPDLNVPFVLAENGEQVRQFFREVPWPMAVKPVGLTGGKGAKVLGKQLASERDAAQYALQCLDKHGVPVLLEQLIRNLSTTLRHRRLVFSE